MTDTAKAFLLAQGVAEDEIEQATQEGWIGLLLVDRLLSLEPTEYDLNDMARLTGTTPDFARKFWRAVGLPDRPADDRQFTESDVQALKALEDMVRGLPVDEEELIERTRVVNAALSRIAEVFVELVAELEDITDSPDELVHTVLTSYPTTQQVLDNARIRQIKLALQRRVGAGTPGRNASDTAVGFADLVGFTTLSRRVPLDELTDVINRFESLAYDAAAAHGTRIVKTIGDEVMFSGRDPAGAAELALDLVERSDRDPRLPDVRVGLDYGPVVDWHGDQFGPVVNRASRLVHAARRGAVVISAPMRDELVGHRDRFKIRSLGRQPLKGIGIERVWRLRRVQAT